MKGNPAKLTCPLLYNHLSFNNMGEQTFCAVSMYSNTVQEGEGIFSSNYEMKSNFTDFESQSKKAREAFKQGQFPKECHICHKYESLGLQSYREKMVSQFPELTKNILGESATPCIEFIEIKLGNDCNLKCRMCNPYSSKSLLKEYKEIFPKSQTHFEHFSFDYYKDPKFFKELLNNAPHLKTIHFSGGEPFIIKEMWNFIDHLIISKRAQDISLKFNTNFTIFTEEMLNKLNHFKHVNFIISLDGVGETFEYIRYPAKWTTIEKNLAFLKSKAQAHFEVLFSPTIQVLNIHQLPRLMEYFKQDFEMNFDIDLNILSHPKPYSIGILPKPIKMEIKMMILSELKNMLNGLPFPEKSLEQIKGILNLLKE